MTYKLPEIPNFTAHVLGLWDTSNIRVEYYSLSWAQLSCRRLGMSGDTVVKNVYFTPIDRLLKVDFDVKVKKVFDKLKKKLELKNDLFEELHRKSLQIKGEK